MLKKILIGVAVVVVLFVFAVSTRPDTFRIERFATMDAPPEIPFANVNDFHAWAKWSPWEHLDPAMTKEFEGPASGPGAKYHYTGNGDVGEGRMTIDSAEKPSRVAITIQFLKPFEATNQVTFTFAKAGDGTKVTWTMDGKNNFVSKAMGMFMNMDKLVGGDFEKGLAALKTVSEAEAKAAPKLEAPKGETAPAP
ncbi:MAG: SRPBCC family protein [Polyangiaceae bacterium]